MAKKTRSDRIAAIVFFLSYSALLGGGALVYGIAAHWKNWAPVPQLDALWEQVKELLPGADAILTIENIRHENGDTVATLGDVAPGLVLVSGDYEPRKTSVRVMRRDGTLVHEWQVTWQSVWPRNEGDFPTGRRPASDMYLHGVDILPDGSIVGNFEHLSTFRMDLCGEVLWKLDNLGHHSAHYDGQDAIWVSAEDYFPENPTGINYHFAPLRSWTIQKLDLDGNILVDKPVIEILYENELDGLLYASFLQNSGVAVIDDTLHLNDVESFPPDMEPGFFDADDLVLSLRNISSVLVVDAQTWEIKFISVGEVLRQHDPDFISGDTISVFDNRYPVRRDGRPRASFVVEFDGPTGEMTTVLRGDGAYPFFTSVQGAHDRLANGNIMVIESDGGRVLEYAPDGTLVWRYSNRMETDGSADPVNLRVYNAQVLPPEMDEAFFTENLAQCEDT